MSGRDWRGIAVVILSLGLAVSLVLAFVAGLVNDKTVPQWVTYLVFAVMGGLIGVVGGYVKVREEEHHHVD